MGSVSPKVTSSSNEVSGTLKRLNANAEAFQNGDLKAREAMIADCFALVAGLENPNETFVRLIWPYMAHPITLRLASNMGIFEALKARNGDPTSTDELAKTTSSDPKLTRKVLQILASFHAITEVDIDSWKSTEFSDAMADPVWKASIDFMLSYTRSAYGTTPDFLRETNYQFPTNPLDTPIQYAMNVRGKMHWHDILGRDGQNSAFENLMKVIFDRRPHWSAEDIGFYPVGERLINGTDTAPEAVFLVDVGGGHGHDFRRLFANLPPEQIPGRLILQDLPDVISLIEGEGLPKIVETMAYDYFTPQPVKGARTYFLHSIIHNHPDDQAKLILKQVVAAMKRGYSKLLIWDFVMPDKEAAVNALVLDFIMMAFYASEQRSEAHWRKLLEDPEIGLKITEVFTYSPDNQALIELELA